MNHVSPSAPVAGASFPKYLISEDGARSGTRRPAASGGSRSSGAVRRPLSLTLDDLMKLPRITQKVDHFCVEGWNARATWSGVRVSDLARAAQATDDAQLRRLRRASTRTTTRAGTWRARCIRRRSSRTGWTATCSTPAHGAPARLHSPVKLGYKNTKYLTRVVFMPTQNGGYWSDQGYEWYGGT